MTKKSFFLSGLLGVCLLAASVPEARAQAAQINRPELRAMLVELGYPVTDLVTESGKEKYSVTLVRDDLNMPVGIEISPSGSYIWLTANLGLPPSPEKALELLKLNANTQPTFFYVTKSGRLMCALAIENRSVTIAVVRQKLDKFTTDIGANKLAWQ